MTGPRPPADGDEEPGAAGTPDEPTGHEAAPLEGEPTQRAEDDFSDVSLGQLLREVRQKQALSLGEVERDTRINRDYLEALEQERYELLPAPVYTRGFVRAYARHLGLDEQAAVSLLPAELPSPSGLEPIAGLRGGPRAFLPSVNPPVLAAAAALVLLAIVALSLTLLRGGEDAPVDAPLGSPAAATATAAAGAAPAADAVPAATVPPFNVGETPNFIGVGSETAQALLTQLGLRFVVIEVETSEAPKGRVFAQTPEPGSPIAADGDVTLIVSRGDGG